MGSSKDIGQRLGWLRLSLVGVTSLYLYLNLFALSNTPYLRIGDQIYFWSGAMRMIYGDHIYRDFFQFTPPGIDFYFLGLFRIFGVHLWVTDLALILLGVALCWICFELASQIMDQGFALLATAIYLVFIYGRILDATHHWLSIFAIACALRVMTPARTTARVAAAGALLGLACFFTQTSGALALAGVSLALALEHSIAQRSWRDIARLQTVLVASFLVVLGVECAPFIVAVGWKQLWYLWITYASHNVVYTQHFLAPATIQAEAHKSLRTFLQHFSVLGLMLCVYPLVVWRCVRRRTRPEFQHGMQLLLLALPGFLLMIEVMIKPNWNRIYMVSLPAFLLFGWWLAGVEGRMRKAGQVLLWTAAVYSGLSQTISAHRRAGVTMDLPAGRAIPVDARYNPEFQWLSQNTSPGDYMLQAAWLNTYLPLKLRDPVYIDALWPGPKTPQQYVRLAIVQVEQRHVKYVLWSPQMIGPVDLGANRQDSLSPFREYLLQHYRRVQIFPSGDEIWQRQAR